MQTNSDSTNREETRTVMLVDDNMDVRTVISMGLEILGYQVVKCVDGRDAIERFKEDSPDVAIIDQGLPDIKGIEVGRQIRELAKHRHVAIALLTGSDGPTLRQQAVEAGFDGFLVKPIRMQALSKWIDSQIKNLDG